MMSGQIGIKTRQMLYKDSKKISLFKTNPIQKRKNTSTQKHIYSKRERNISVILGTSMILIFCFLGSDLRLPVGI